MKSRLFILFFIAINVVCKAQDTVITISPAMFNPINEIMISEMNGWQFKKHGDSLWLKLKPGELSAKLADKNNRVEGWLKFRFKLSPEFTNTSLGLRYSGWAAAELYMDGKLLQSFGKIGTDAASFTEYNPSNKMPVLINVQTGVEHEITIRFADYINSFSSGKLKSNKMGLYPFIKFTGPQYHARFAKHIREWPVYSTFWISVCTVLTLLFWLLAFLNRREKNLTLFAVCASLFLAMFYFQILTESDTISFKGYVISFAAFELVSAIATCFTLIIVARIFKDKVAGWVKVIIAILFLLGVVNIFVQGPAGALLAALGTLIPVFVYLSYIFSSRKTLKGAQWAIVIGLLLYSFLVFLYIAMIVKYKTSFIPYNMLIASGLILSFPLSLLVYIALRFKEIVNEVRQNAEQVLKLSEEKKEQALKQQKILEEEVARQTVELRTSLENLKATQSQLIQSEKMASLGELTAGIAHEIQNPLNFVNNFSEVNTELISELVDEIDNGNKEEAKQIASDIKDNSEKINYHGKRADSIVKGMLQHSRSSSGQKEPVDINNLADECLRLSFHGMRAKDKSFNAKTETAFDAALPKANIVSQDIGRVLLNLFTNSFYAVMQKKKQAAENYSPVVSVSTARDGNRVKIVVRDNGNGIPQKVIDKIFQPFFTTKPTGEGTGLGLSMSYDIITKGHGGELKVDTKEGEFAEFTIILPV